MTAEEQERACFDLTRQIQGALRDGVTTKLLETTLEVALKYVRLMNRLGVECEGVEPGSEN